MAFVNDSNFQDDFRKVGDDATASFEPVGAPANPTQHPGSENLNAAAAVDEDDDLEDDDELEEDDELDDEDDDLEDDDDEIEPLVDDDDDDLEDDDDEDLDDEEDDDDDVEDDDAVAMKARLHDAEKTARWL